MAAWRLQIRRIDKRNQLLKSIIKGVNDFFYVKIESNKMDKSHIAARRVYYKCAMEKQIKSCFVSKMIKRNRPHTAEEGRRFLTRSFKTNAEAKNQYHNFLNSIAV